MNINDIISIRRAGIKTRIVNGDEFWELMQMNQFLMLSERHGVIAGTTYWTSEPPTETTMKTTIEKILGALK